MHSHALRSSLRGTVLAAPVMALAVLACTQSQPEPLPAIHPPVTTAVARPLSTMPGCPLSLPQSSVEVMDRPDGAAVELAAPRDELRALRARAGDIQREGDRGLIRACPCGAGVESTYPAKRLGPGETSDVPRSALVPPPAVVGIEDTEAGVRLTFRAKATDDVRELRRVIRLHMQQLLTGACGEM